MVEHRRFGGPFSGRELVTYRSSDAGDMAALAKRGTIGISWNDRLSEMETWAKNVLRQAHLPGTFGAYRVNDGPWVGIADGAKAPPLKPGMQSAAIIAVAEIEGHPHDSPVGYAAKVLWLV